ncbi:hypothetical protein OG948_01420 [Embleya sp. NBC_00888]|uniref:hypothetical protein n=1 Tax=Embleya sp. NBC_00888 TaxID=2975960 RepID=UPI00386774FA|nr:hypothetical protein OG948_01420 [Embleya sp. NBC_00888]
MRNENTPLAFENDLLGELTALVEGETVAQAATTVPLLDSHGARRRRRRAYGLVVSGAAAAVVAVVGPLVLGGKSAQAAPFTVVRQPDGTIRFAIDEFRDPEGLETRLRRLGVPAKVDYLPAGKGCAAGRFPGGTLPRDTVEAAIHYVKPPMDRLMTDEESAYFRQAWQEIRPERIPPGTTLVLTETIFDGPKGSEQRTAVGNSDLARGTVAPCVPVDDPNAPRVIDTEDGQLVHLGGPPPSN